MSAIIPAVPRLRREHPVANGLVAYYPFYEGSGGLLHDIAGRNLTGILTNMDPATDWVASPYGYALDFDGSDDSVEIANHPALTDLPNGPFSISAWWQITNNGTNAYLINKQAGSSTNGWEIHADQFNRVGLTIQRATTDQRRFAGFTSYGNWSHIAMVFDGSLAATGIRFWVNGVEPAYQIPIDGVGAYSSDAALSARIGRSNFGVYLTGRVNSTAVWNRALSVDEVALLYSQPDLLIEPPSTRRIYLFKSAGGAMSGTAALVFAASGTLAGGGELGGVALLTFAASGTAAGAGAMSGSAAMAFGASGSATGDADMTGTAALAFSASGNMASGGDMTGTAALTFAASGSLTGGGTLAGGAALVFTASGTLSSGALSGSISMVWSANGTMSGCRRYSGCVDTDYNYDSPAATGRRYSGCDAQASDYTYEAS